MNTVLAERFAAFSVECRARAPLYAELSGRVSRDPAMVSMLEAAPTEQQIPVLFFAAVHDLVLRNPETELANLYASVTARRYEPATNDRQWTDESAWPLFRRFVVDHEREVRDIVATHSTQTNEIGRCATLLPALATVSAEMGSLAHLDVGASGGLNLLLEHYGYRYTRDESPIGEINRTSAVLLECSVRGGVALPHHMPQFSQHVGLDRSPIDLADDAQRRWLRACLWPDQKDRLDRLDAAFAIAADNPPDVRHGDAVVDMPPLVEALATHGHPTITTTWVLNYLPMTDRLNFVERLDELGTQFDLSWISVEAPAQTPGLPQSLDAEEERSILALVRWRNGIRSTQLLGVCHPHGYWLHAI